MLLKAPAALVLASVLPAGGQPAFRSASELVLVDVMAESRKTGVPIRSLQQDDFEIYEDGVRQQISHFSLDTMPLSIVFLLDMTDSVRPVLKPLAAGAIAALDRLKPEDEIAVMLYAERADLTLDFGTDHERVARAMEAAGTLKRGACGPKPPLCSQLAYFNEGVFQAAAHLKDRGNRGNRGVVIWLTDNVPNVPSAKAHSEAAAFDLLHETGVVVCSLLERSSESYTLMALYAKNPLLEPLRRRRPPGDVRRYAAESGGVSINANRDEIGTKLEDLIDRIRSRYTVGYRPAEQKPAGTISKIEVGLSSAASAREGEMEVHARQAYKH
jgi:VWFA-related protein